MRLSVLVLTVWLASLPCIAAAPALARPRPPLANAIPLPPPRAPQPSSAESAAPPSECFLQLTSRLAIAQPLPPIAQADGCEASDVVRLDSVLLDNHGKVPLQPPAILRCSMATAIANWVRDDVVTLAASILGATGVGIENHDSYDCRGRNRVAGATISEHGRANALDIRALAFSDGRRITLTDPEVSNEFREALRATACARFTTVLGPGSDSYHEDHIHLDLAERRSGHRICQWDVRLPTVPLPRAPPTSPEQPLTRRGRRRHNAVSQHGGYHAQQSCRPRH